MTEPAQAPSLKDMAIEVVHKILGVYGLLDEAEVAEGEWDYRLDVIDNDQNLTLNISIDDEAGRILAGKRQQNLQAMQKLLISAIHFRLDHGPRQKLERFVRLSVNGQFADPKKENGDNKVVTIIIPSGVELRTLNPDGTNR